MPGLAHGCARDGEAARGRILAPVYPGLDGTERIEAERLDPGVAVVVAVPCGVTSRC